MESALAPSPREARAENKVRAKPPRVVSVILGTLFSIKIPHPSASRAEMKEARAETPLVGASPALTAAVGTWQRATRLVRGGQLNIDGGNLDISAVAAVA